MPPISTTQTLVDAQREHKDLQDKHTHLKGEFERDTNKHNEILHATESLREEQKKIREEMESTVANALHIIEEAKGAVKQALSLMGIADLLSERWLGFVRVLQAKVDGLRADAKTAQNEIEVAHAKIVEEEALFATKKRDLEIYEHRLNARIVEAGLQDEIKIPR